MHRPVAKKGGQFKDRSLKRVGKGGPDVLSIFMIGSMRPHALRKRLCSPVLNAANDAAVVEDMRGRQANEAFDLSLWSVKR